jgi:hypothetical protein
MTLLEDLAELIASHPQHQNAQPAFVSVYRKHRCYGGPEEGGWWYTRHALEGYIPFPTQTAAETWLKDAKSLVEKQNHKEAPSRWKAMANLPDHETAYHDEGYIPQGWDDGGELWVTIESQPGASDNSNEPTPHYC